MHRRFGFVQLVGQPIPILRRLWQALHAAVLEDQQRRWLRKPSSIPPQKALNLVAFVAHNPKRGIRGIDQQDHLNRRLILRGYPISIHRMERDNRPRFFVVQEREILPLETGDGPARAIGHHHIEFDLAFGIRRRRWTASERGMISLRGWLILSR